MHSLSCENLEDKTQFEQMPPSEENVSWLSTARPFIIDWILAVVRSGFGGLFPPLAHILGKGGPWEGELKQSHWLQRLLGNDSGRWQAKRDVVPWVLLKNSNKAMLRSSCSVACLLPTVSM